MQPAETLKIFCKSYYLFDKKPKIHRKILKKSSMKSKKNLQILNLNIFKWNHLRSCRFLSTSKAIP